MDVERDAYGVAIMPEDRMHDVLLGLYDVLDQAEDFSEFSESLLTELRRLRARFVDEFKRGTHPTISQAEPSLRLSLHGTPSTSSQSSLTITTDRAQRGERVLGQYPPEDDSYQISDEVFALLGSAFWTTVAVIAATVTGLEICKYFSTHAAPPVVAWICAAAAIFGSGRWTLTQFKSHWLMVLSTEPQDPALRKKRTIFLIGGSAAFFGWLGLVTYVSIRIWVRIHAG